MRGRIVALGVVGLLALFAWPLTAGAQPNPSVRITSPRDGATVRGPMVGIKLQFQNWKSVEAGTEPRPGEGHVHLLIDQEVPGPGETVPTADGFVHLGTPPFDSRSIELPPGEHTITAVLGDSTHKVIEPVATHQIRVTVLGEAAPPPTRPANTGDGSMSDEGLGPTGAIALLIGAASLAITAVRRRV